MITIFASVFLKSVRDQRRGLLGWGIGIALLVLVESALWPSVRDMPDLSEFLANYPEALQKLFQLDAMTTPTGFLNAELFTLLLPVLFIVYGVGRGARMIVGEEEAGTLDAVLVTPVSTRRLVIHKAAALGVALGCLGLVLACATVAASAVFSMDISVSAAADASLSMTLIGIEYGWLALAIGAVSGRRVVAVALAGIAAVAAYVLYVAGTLVDRVQPWQPVSPFDQALSGGPLGAGLPVSYLWMALAAVLFVALAVPVFDRRDIGAH